MNKENHKFLIYGLRKKLDITQDKLSNLINSKRRMIGKYEEGVRFLNLEKIEKILNLVHKSGYDLNTLIKHGKKHFSEVKNRENSKALNLEYSEELAELMGIILGDGCIQKDGTIIIAFNKSLEMNFIERRVIYLVNKFVKVKTNIKMNKITNTGEVRFYSKPFVKFLESKCSLKGGNKIKNKTTIPLWCFKNKKYISAVLRGLFDTDGYFDPKKPSVRVSFRTSSKCGVLIKDIEKGLNLLDINFTTNICGDGASIRLNSREMVLKFFKIVGSSNIKHITRFLLWRLKKFDSRMSKENINSLIKKANGLINFDVRKTEFPFLWNETNLNLNKRELEKDLDYLKICNLKRNYNWGDLCKDLFKNCKKNEVAKDLKINPRSINRWIKGDVRPHKEYIPQIIKLARKNLNLKNYENGGKNKINS